jgi:nitroreductase
MQNTIEKALNWRYATKIFIKGKQVPVDVLNSILESGRMAPTCYGLQPFKIIHVVSPEIREQLKEVSYGQSQVTDAGDFFIITRRTDIDNAFVDAYIKDIAETRGMKVEDLAGFAEAMKGDIISRNDEAKATWSGRQAYITLGMMLETAALLEVDTCPMEGFNTLKVDEILNLQNDNLASVAYMAVGYRGEGDVYATLPKVRVSIEDLIIQK